VRGSIFEILGEEPGQAWNVKEELKYETHSSDWEEQAAHFVPIVDGSVSCHSASAGLQTSLVKDRNLSGKKSKINE